MVDICLLGCGGGMPMPFRSLSSTILNFKSILGKNADGILGINSFNNKSHKIDYVKREISLIDNFNGYDKIKFEFKNYRILLPLEIRFSNNRYIKGSFLLVGIVCRYYFLLFSFIRKQKVQ